MYRPEDFQKAGVGFHLLRAGIFVGQGDMVAQRFIHEGMGVSFNIDGSVFDQREAGECLLHPGDVICHWPQTWHKATEYQGQPLQTIWMELVGPSVPDVAHLFGATPSSPVTRPSNPGEIHTLFQEIVAGFHSPERMHPGHFLQRFHRIAELCAESRRRGGPPRRAAETLAQRATRILETGMLTFPTVAQLATELGVSQNSLLNACRSELEITAVELVTRVKLQKARELLRTTDFKLLHIAQSCGFRSLSHFMHAFRKAEKMTPGDWRIRR